MAETNNTYEQYTDEELIDMLRDGLSDVADYLMNKYKNLVRGKARTMFILGADEEDLIQEGMIGLFKAIRDFDAGRDTSFITFAQLCVVRQMYTAVQAASRQKNAPLNTYISIYEEDFQKEGGINPEEEFLDKERVELMQQIVDKELSFFEKQALELKLTGMDYKEIAAVLGRDSKATDNALNRAKNKLGKAFVNF